MVVLLSICLWYVSTVATCIAVHFAVCHALYNNKNKKLGKNRCLVFFLMIWSWWFNWWISFAPEFQCDNFCESSCLFYLSLNSDFYVSKIMHL